MKLPYNQNDKNSIIEYAKKLKDKSLRQVCDADLIRNDRKGKGHFGQILEEFYFHYKPNSDAEPDFSIAKLELKTSPLKRLKNNEYRSKERLVLNIINYFNVVNQNFENSDFIKKNASILLIFYLHQAGCDILDLIIKLVDEWSFPSTDLEIIKKDWETINKKIADANEAAAQQEEQTPARSSKTEPSTTEVVTKSVLKVVTSATFIRGVFGVLSKFLKK